MTNHNNFYKTFVWLEDDSVVNITFIHWWKYMKQTQRYGIRKKKIEMKDFTFLFHIIKLLFSGEIMNFYLIFLWENLISYDKAYVCILYECIQMLGMFCKIDIFWCGIFVLLNKPNISQDLYACELIEVWQLLKVDWRVGTLFYWFYLLQYYMGKWKFFSVYEYQILQVWCNIGNM